MKSNYKILGVIPARGGSKGVPRKNLSLINGKPLISYTIDAAKNSKLLTDVIVSTDDDEITKIAKEYGGDVPFRRPDELATDSALSISVVKHALVEMENIKKIKYDYVMLLQPTSPFRKSLDIDESLEIILNSSSDSLVSVVDVGGHHPFRMKRIVGDNQLINFMEQGFEDMRPRQVLPKVYIRSGSIYISKRELILDNNQLVGNDCKAYVMPIDRSVNIDNKMDLLLAELNSKYL